MKQSSLATQTSYAESVSPQWVSLLDLLAMNVRYERCQGAEMFADDGTCYLDFLSGYCVHNTGHNHPYIVEALKQELDRSGPAMLQSHVPELAGELGQRLCTCFRPQRRNRPRSSSIRQRPASSGPLDV